MRAIAFEGRVLLLYFRLICKLALLVEGVPGRRVSQYCASNFCPA
jgi:hypothetical protein